MSGAVAIAAVSIAEVVARLRRPVTPGAPMYTCCDSYWHGDPECWICGARASRMNTSPPLMSSPCSSRFAESEGDPI